MLVSQWHGAKQQERAGRFSNVDRAGGLATVGGSKRRSLLFFRRLAV